MSGKNGPKGNTEKPAISQSIKLLRNLRILSSALLNAELENDAGTALRCLYQ